MNKMKAIVTDPGAPGHVRMAEVDAPQPKASETLLRVQAFSVNRGEVRMAMASQREYVPGWDVVGVVEQAAADGSGPRAGARAVGLMTTGGWAELAAVPGDSVAELPDQVSFRDAAALPVAGLTALYAVQKGNNLLERSVLVTGASGGVGLLAIQLARLSGAIVTGLTRQASHLEIVRQAGAHQALSGEDAAPAAEGAPYHLILDSVGGQVLGGAMTLLEPRGICVSYGATAGSEVTFNASKFYTLVEASLYALLVWNEARQESAAAGLARLIRLLAKGQLNTFVKVEEPWGNIASVAQRLTTRDYVGKAVVYIQ